MKRDRELIDQIKLSYIHMCENLKKDGKISDYSINDGHISEDDFNININITPVSVVKHIDTSFTINLDGCEFNDE